MDKMDKKINDDTEEQAALFRALADPTRLRLMKLLCQQHEPSALCVNALAYRLGISQSAVSQHLRVLKALKLVKGERRGYRVHYFINEDEVNHLRTLISSALFTQAEKEKP